MSSYSVGGLPLSGQLAWLSTGWDWGGFWALLTQYPILIPGLQRRRLIPAPLPDATALGRKPSLPGQWVDLPPPLAGSLKEPFEIKVYEIDDVERLQRHRLPLREDPDQIRVCGGLGWAGGCEPWGGREGSSGSWGCGQATLRPYLLFSTALPGSGEGRWPLIASGEEGG